MHELRDPADTQMQLRCRHRSLHGEEIQEAPEGRQTGFKLALTFGIASVFNCSAGIVIRKHSSQIRRRRWKDNRRIAGRAELDAVFYHRLPGATVGLEDYISLSRAGLILL